MKNSSFVLLFVTFILCFVLSCADNPLGLSEGMWVKHKLDGQKYYIAKIDLANNNDDGTMGYVEVKNELGVKVDKKFAISDFDLWIDGGVDEKRLNRQLGLVLKELTAARKAYEGNPSEATKERLGEAIERGERSVTADSPVFAPKKWNPTTQKYE